MARRSFEDELNAREERARRRRRRPRADEPSGQTSESARPRRRRRWPFFLFLLVLLIGLLPNLIGWLGLQQHAVDFAASDFKGKLAIEQVSMGWLQPIELTNVSAVDESGNPLFQVESVKSKKRLFQLAASGFNSSADFGQFDVVKPVGYLELRPDGSNIEDAFASYLQPAPEPPPTQASVEVKPLPKLKLNLVNGTASVVAIDSGKRWQLDQLNVVAETSTDNAPLVLDAQCRVTPVFIDDAGQPVLQNAGGFSLASQFDSGSDLLSFSSADILLETQSIPVSLAAPVLRRLVGPATSDGNLSGRIEAAYSSQSNSVAVNAQQVNLSGFSINAPDLIGRDTVSVQNLTANGQLQLSPTVVSAKQFNVKSEVGRINAEGEFDVNQLANLASNPNLLDTPFQMNGEIDLAQLIRMLPSTLQLHQDLTVNSGKINFSADSRNENGNRRMVVNLDTANLNAKRGTQTIVWSKPLRVVGTIQENAGQLSLEDVRCESDFLTLAGSASRTTGSFVASGDLDKLMDRVSQFADLKGTKLAGVLNGKFGWQVEPGANPTDDTTSLLPVQIGGSFVIDNPIIEMAGLPRWQEKQMSVKLSASGKSKPSKLHLDQGGVQVEIGNEKLVTTLAEPVSNAYNHDHWKANCHATGSLKQWLAHVRNFVDIGTFESDGNATAIFAASLTGNQVLLRNIQYEVTEFGFDGYGMKIRDPKVSGTADLNYNLANGAILIPKTSLVSSSVSAASENLKISFPGNMRVDGAVAYKADVNRLAEWFELSTTPESIYWFGTLDGSVQFESSEHGIGGRINGKITDLIAAQQFEVAPTQPAPGQAQTLQASQPRREWREIWREPTVNLGGNVSMANDFNALALQNVSVDSQSLRATTSGAIADLGGAMVTDLEGTWNPNWSNLNSLLAGYTGELVQFSGTGEKTFVVKGSIFSTGTPNGELQPWVSPELQAATSIGWDQGEVFGLGVGQSQVDINVQQSVAFMQTAGIPFAGGVVKFAPQVDMRGEQPVVVMDSTRVIDNVELKPETARQWLKYVAPLVADATSAQGQFTVDVGGLQMPLFDPLKVQAQGAIHLSNVVVGAGPTADQLLATIKQVRAMLKPEAQDRDMRTWLTMDQQSVPYVVRDGRVYHENLKFSHKDLVVRTKGSVGIDQTLQMVAQIAIHDDWIAGKPYLAGLKGQSLSIPISGTVAKPIIDRRALQQLSQDLAKQAAGSALNKVIGDKLNPKMQEYQNQLNNKINEELNGIQSKLGEKLGGTIFPVGSESPLADPGGASGTTQQAGSIGDQIGNRLEDELKKGIGNLFGK